MATPEVELYEETETLSFQDGKIPNIHLVYWSLREVEKKEGTNIIFWVHGIGEHSNRSKTIAQTLLKRCDKLEVFMSFDLRGHGKSEGNRGVTTGINELSDDIKEYILPKMSLKYNNTSNIILCGHSLGGGIIINMLLNENKDFLKTNDYGNIIGIFLSAPSIKVPINGFFNKLLAPFINTINYIPGMKYLTKPNELDCNELSHDPNVKSVNDNDQLMHNKLSFGLGADMLSFHQKCLDSLNSEKNQSILKSLPVCIVQGEQDNVTSIDGSKDFVECLNSNGSSMCSVTQVPKGKHELMFELDDYGRVEFFDHYVQFVNQLLEQHE